MKREGGANNNYLSVNKLKPSFRAGGDRQSVFMHLLIVLAFLLCCVGGGATMEPAAVFELLPRGRTSSPL